MLHSEVRGIAFNFWSDHVKDVEVHVKQFNEETELAGRHWFECFCDRYPALKMKAPIQLSIARAMGSNEANVFSWFDTYEEIVDRLKLREKGERIWNLDEKGLEDLPHVKRVVGISKQDTFQLVSGEKSIRSTMLFAASGAGNFAHPMIIHKGTRRREGWDNCKPQGVLLANSKKGHINKELFHEFGLHLIKEWHDLGLLGGNIVLVMDSHFSHLFNWNFMDLMREYRVTVVGLRPHTSHLCQPLDKVPFTEMEKNWHKELRKYNLRVGAKKIVKQDWFSVFNVAFFKSMTRENLQAGFKLSGIFPVDRDRIPKEKFAPSRVTDCSELVVCLCGWLC